jgi:hypothetical protein
MAALLSVMTGARAEDAVINDQTVVHVPAFSDLCDIKPAQHLADNAVFERTATIMETHGKLLSYSTDCAALDRLRNGEGGALDEWALLAVNYQQDGTYMTVPSGMSRADAIAELAGVSESSIQENMEAGRVAFNERVDDALGDLYDGTTLAGVRPLGILEYNDKALYTGALLRLEEPEGTRIVAGVVGITTHKNYFVSLSYYKVYEDDSTIPGLLDVVREEVTEFLDANSSAAAAASIASDATTDGDDSNGTAIVVSLIAGGAAVGGVAVLLVGVLVRRRRGAR